jgi:hypothetical protein
LVEIRRGVLRAFDSGSYTATVEVAGSIATWLSGIAVARNIDSSELVTGRNVALLLFDPSNPNDMVLCAVWT